MIFCLYGRTIVQPEIFSSFTASMTMMGGFEMKKSQQLILGILIGVFLFIGFTIGEALTENVVFSMIIALLTGLAARIVGQLVIKKMN